MMDDGLFIRSYIFRHFIVLSFSLTNDSVRYENTLKDFKNAKMNFIKFANFLCINFIEILQQ